MILQQQTKDAVWGWTEPGETVTVTASWGATATAQADSGGRWKLFLQTPVHGTGHSLNVVGKNTIRISNVAVGEVWLCAGQSNMGWAMGNSFEADKETDVDLANFRIFKSQREHWHEPLEESRDRLQQWKPCNSESAAETSAVSYCFGKTLHQQLDVPVGIIVQAYAGTPIEGWMPWDIQKNDTRTIEHRQSLDENARRRIRSGETVAKALETFEQELAAYNAKIDAGETMKNAFSRSRVSSPGPTTAARQGRDTTAFSTRGASLESSGCRQAFSRRSRTRVTATAWCGRSCIWRPVRESKRIKAISLPVRSCIPSPRYESTTDGYW